MKDRLVCKRLKLLSAKELVRFAKYSKRESSNSPVWALSDLLVKQLYSEKLTQQKAFKIIYKNEAFSLPKLNKVCSKLNALLNRFIITHLSETPDDEQEILDEMELLKFYTNRGVGEFGQASIKKIEKLLEKKNVKDEFYFKQKTALSKMSNSLLQRTLSKKRNYQKANDHLDQWYCFVKLDQLAEMGTDAKLHNRQYNFHLADSILAHLDSKPYGEQPVLELLSSYYKVSLGGQDLSYVENFEVQIEKNIDSLSKTDAQKLFTVLTNAYYFAEPDKYKLSKKIFDLMTYQIDKEILLVDGFLPPLMLENYTSLSLKVKDPDWALQMVDDLKDNLLPEYRKGSYHYNISKCLLAKKAYNEAASELHNINDYKIKYLSLNLATRRLRIKIYYKLSMKDSEYNRYEPSRTITSFKKFLFDKKNDLAEEIIESNNAFCKIVLRLSEFTSNKDASKILSQINETKRLDDRSWLIAEVKELI